MKELNLSSSSSNHASLTSYLEAYSGFGFCSKVRPFSLLKGKKTIFLHKYVLDASNEIGHQDEFMLDRVIRFKFKVLADIFCRTYQ